MNAPTTTRRAVRLLSLLGAIVIFGSLFWFASDVISTGLGRTEFPSELAAHFVSSSLPEGLGENESLNSENRALYAALADEFYSPLHQSEASRSIAYNPTTGKTVAELSPVLGHAKVQCNIRTSASSLDNINGVAMNTRECF